MGPLSASRRFGVRTLRRILATRGYSLTRCENPGPGSLEAYLRALSRRGLKFDRIGLLDSDPEPARALYGLFPADIVFGDSQPVWSVRCAPAGVTRTELVLTEANRLGAADLRPLKDHLAAARLVILRGKPADFSAGLLDAIALATQMQSLGFRCCEVIYPAASGLIAAAILNLYLVFDRPELVSTEPLPAGALDRTAQALNHLSLPIAALRPLVLTGRGSNGLGGGISNPGALQTPQGLVLLGRGERTAWPLQKRSWPNFAASSQPVRLVLQPDLKIERTDLIAFEHPALPEFVRAEDFRLFEHAGEIFANHSVISADAVATQRLPIDPQRLRSSVGISRFDLAGSRLTYRGALQLDSPVTAAEKNWAMFSSGGAVRLIYSFDPYLLLTAQDFSTLRFSTTAERRFSLPLPADGLALRNSINPVPYDRNHWLHVVHKVYAPKQYVFWAVLIGRKTLLPVKISSRPLLRGIASSGASILYASSAVVREDEVLFFGGLNDCGIGAWRVGRVDLDRHWQTLT